MRQTRPLSRGGVVSALAIAIVLGVFAGTVATGVLAPYALSGPSTTAPGGPYTLYLTVAFNPGSGHDEYFPANFTVPAHTLVIVTIADYDNGSNPVPAVDGVVQGTVGGTETVVNATYPSGHAVSSVNGTEVAHTFTVATGGYALNVPVPPANRIDTAGNIVPTLVTFGTYFNLTGTFVWHCLAPCDAWSMRTPGYMMGTLTVEAP